MVLHSTSELMSQEERPRHPPKIFKTDVLNNPFPDIEPRIINEKEKTSETKPKVKGTKYFLKQDQIKEIC